MEDFHSRPPWAVFTRPRQEIPKVEVRYVEKTVEVPQIEWVERVVEVPQITYEECGRLRSETKGGARTCLGAGKHGVKWGWLTWHALRYWLNV